MNFFVYCWTKSYVYPSTVCPRSLALIYIVTKYMKGVKTAWTDSTMTSTINCIRPYDQVEEARSYTFHIERKEHLFVSL